MSDINLSAKAYCKIILHAAKYPYCAVNGVLLAKTDTLGKSIEFVDAIPLFHIGLYLTPMAEIALMQIDELASHKNLTIAGYYSAAENLQENSFEKAQNRIADKIAANCPKAFMFVVNNMQLSNYLDNVALKVAQYVDGSQRACDVQRICLNPDKTLDICSRLLERRSYDDLVDFDNHLDDIRLDWKNPGINKEIEELL